MKVAIHPFENSFSDRWISYCQKNNIDYKLVDCFSTDIVQTIKDCDVLLWHWSQENYKAKLIALELTKVLEISGIKVFPNSNTAWYFDNKIAQKYALEAIDAPLINTWVFYDKHQAFQWMKKATFPKVFKLSGGAGGINVHLVKNLSRAKSLINQAFGKGFGASGRYSLFKNRIWRLKRDRDLSSFLGLVKGLARLFIKSELERYSGKEIGYVYFQEFIPENDFDIRVIVIGNKAFAIKRHNRKGDFRASGSGIITYLNETNIDRDCLKIAFDVTKKLQSQCIAFDFVYDLSHNPLIIEISYGFAMKAYDQCEGYWDDNLTWFEGPFVPQNFIIEDLINHTN